MEQIYCTSPRSELNISAQSAESAEINLIIIKQDPDSNIKQERGGCIMRQENSQDTTLVTDRFGCGI